ncbi:SDR family NAD(P)-dependent oxidoreductase [Microlunatus endophyticus]|nr:SDR family NAD(P)-dependent oxidoreductase [Microlunatus endophyticus]
MRLPATPTGWSVRDLPVLAGRTVIVTGASSGIGAATATALAAAGARVIAAVRDVERGRTALAGVPGTIEIRRLDLADLAAVRSYVATIFEPVDIVINNAGVIGGRLRRTADGFELQFGTNHLGHFALTGLLLPMITDRVVTVASVAHRHGRIDLADPNFDHRRYRAGTAYAQSKLANLLFTQELQARLDAAGSPVRAHAVHPGAVASGIVDRFGPIARAIGPVIVRSSAEGALPLLYAATQPLPGGSYVVAGPRHGANSGPNLSRPSATALDRELAADLWTLSERLTGIRFAISSAS